MLVRSDDVNNVTLGCTTDLYECHHVYVEYTPHTHDMDTSERVSTNTSSSSEAPSPSSPSSLVAALYVNIRACGYPPVTVCQHWSDTSLYTLHVEITFNN